MLASADSMSLLLVLNLVFAVVALAVGFVAGVWFHSSRHTSQGNAPDAEAERQKQIERERAALATDRLRDLAGGVAGDVGEHSARVSEITDALRALDTSDVEATGAGLIDALGKIVTANESLQEKLTKAEEQIAAQAREIHLHESEARTDSLTGLANRRAFDDEMKRRYSESTRQGQPLSLLIMDIDYFKKFNDTHGHQAGDEVLRAVGQQLVATCRDMDLPCRYGGEEFAVVMPATTVAEGTIAAERIRESVESMTVQFEGRELKVTTSVGLAQLSDFDDVARLLKRSDEALYASKGAGRNCGHYHDGSHCLPFTPDTAPTSAKKPAKQCQSVTTTTLDRLPNRTKFAEELRRRMAESNRTEQPIAVLIIELASHSSIREKMGAEVGCAALDAVATVLEQSLRDMDLLARMGENRFAVMLPGNDVETAIIVGDRADSLLDKFPLKIEDTIVDLQLAFGGAEYKTGDSVEVLVGRAEAALADTRDHLVAN